MLNLTAAIAFILSHYGADVNPSVLKQDKLSAAGAVCEATVDVADLKRDRACDIINDRIYCFDSNGDRDVNAGTDIIDCDNQH